MEGGKKNKLVSIYKNVFIPNKENVPVTVAPFFCT
jgi:hypothetical protein